MVRTTAIVLVAGMLLPQGVLPAQEVGDILAQGGYSFRARTPRGDRIRYTIINLGDTHVRAEASVGDATNQRTNARLTESIRRLQLGFARGFREDEVRSDQITGEQVGNWTGGAWSGGTVIRPGGIGPVDVPCLDGRDCLAKQHDIQTWLGANFEPGSSVALLIDGTRYEFTAAPMANADVVSGWIRGSGSVFQPAARRTAPPPAAPPAAAPGRPDDPARGRTGTLRRYGRQERCIVFVREPRYIHEHHGLAEPWYAWARSQFPGCVVNLISPNGRAPNGETVRTLSGGPGER